MVVAHERWHLGAMTVSAPDPELAALGRALEALRRERGLSQAEAGARLNITSQGWGLYESGRRPGLYRPDKQRWLTQALDASPEALALAIVRLSETATVPAPATGVEGGSRTFVAALQRSQDSSKARGEVRGGRAWRGSEPAFAPDTTLESLQLSDDELAPWAASGIVLDYDPARWPRRDQGCVIDTTEGVRLVRIYDRADSERIWVRGGPEGIDTRSSIARADAVRVSAVVSRREPQ
ncbi:hypothetical protein BH10PSE2_BH10PSE2_12190 [soil metagenome]